MYLHRLLAVIVVILLSGACDRAPPHRLPETKMAVVTTDVGEDAAEAPEYAFENPLLWEVTRDDVDGTSYLFGTIHGGLEVSWEGMPPPVREAFESSDVIVLETDIDSVPQAEIAARMMLPEGESLEAKIGEERFQKLVEDTGQPAQILNRFRPWIAQATLVREWVGGDKPIDLRFQTFARAREKDLAYLESPVEQIEILDDAVTVEMLIEFLDEPEPQRQALQQALDAYRKGDADALRTAVIRPKDLERYPEFFELTFSRRNRAWLPKLEKRMRSDSSFVAVGAGHLLGPDNLVESLRKKGWTVSR
jgi:uncharacterized protein YbaP (TraB family)